MEQLVILLLIALISFINWLIKKSSQLREARKREQGAAKAGDSLRSEQGAAKAGDSLRSEPSQAPEAEPEVSMRRLREALGLPDEAQPPALPKRMEQPPRAPISSATITASTPSCKAGCFAHFTHPCA